ncbi:hypothetical protein BU23DRAFT_210488 [Bimuria novae-zelandiae CBS 107.79]|uniref:Uncharacterized protein n=1 Tax=Bimuria novae-zelandiae CBS 107.79 TaxID=1447943 RepID=A0A6A5V3F4_9PLEO|nr:hypothetical protein BU23DRAFT_210488 [Bimuria novae-zelandiae CBS 107.79]
MAATEGSDDVITIKKDWYDTLYTHYHHCPRVNEEERTDRKRGGKKQGNKKGKWANPEEGNEQSSESSEESNDESSDEEGNAEGNEKQQDCGLRHILRFLPEKDKWRAWQDRLFQKEKQYQSIIDNLVSEVMVKTKDLITIGERLALRYTESVKDKHLHAAISRFLLLILSSYCLFLRNNNIGEASIDHILGHITSVGEYRRKRLIRQASLINELIDELVIKGHWYVSRATELFFLLSIPASYLADLRISSFATLRKILVVKFHGHQNFDDCMKVYYSIPTILKNYLDHFDPGNDISLDKIFKDLGYTKSYPLQEISPEKASSISMCFFGATKPR